MISILKVPAEANVPAALAMSCWSRRASAGEFFSSGRAWGGWPKMIKVVKGQRKAEALS